MSIRIKDRIAPAILRCRFKFRRSQDFMPRAVRIEYQCAEVGQLPGDQTLAACHAAQETKGFHWSHFPSHALLSKPLAALLHKSGPVATG